MYHSMKTSGKPSTPPLQKEGLGEDFLQSYGLKDDPQPQVVVAFGLRITNCAPSKPSV